MKKVHLEEYIKDNNHTQAFIRALDYIKSLDPKEAKVLTMSKATYHIYKDGAQERLIHTSNTSSLDFPLKKIAVLVEGIQNLTMDFNESTLIIHGDIMALAILNSSNITIKNLKWDYATPTTSEMTLVDFDKTSATYKIPTKCPYKIEGGDIIWTDLDGYWQEKNDHDNYGIQVYYQDHKMGRSYFTKDGPFANALSIDQVQPGLIKVTYKDHKIQPVIGMTYQLVSNRLRPTSGAFISRSSKVVIQDTHIGYMHGFGFLVQMAEDITFERVKIQAFKDKGTLTSSYADGIHVAGAKGKIEIIDSTFDNTHDDPINIHGTFMRIDQVEGNTAIVSYVHHQQGGFQQFFPGDQCLIYRRSDLLSLDSEKVYRIKEATMVDDRTISLEFDQDLPEYIEEKEFVIENISYTPEVIIKGCDFKNIFTRMILVTTRKKILIEDNNFEPSQMAQIYLSNDAQEWYESGPIRDLTIANNTFNVKSIGRVSWKYAPAIYINPRVTKISGPVHKNIKIIGNTFNLYHDGALRAELVEGLEFGDNIINEYGQGFEITSFESCFKIKKENS